MHTQQTHTHTDTQRGKPTSLPRLIDIIMQFQQLNEVASVWLDLMLVSL